MLDGVLTSGLIHGLPLLAEVRIRWRFFPQSIGGWIAALLIAAACLACDWFFYQWRRGGKLFTRPDWTKLFRWRLTLSDLFEVMCLLSMTFVLARFYFRGKQYVGEDGLFRIGDTWSLSPVTALAATVLILALLYRKTPICRTDLRRLLLAQIAAAVALYTLFYPAGALISPLLLACTLAVTAHPTTTLWAMIAIFTIGVPCAVLPECNYRSVSALPLQDLNYLAAIFAAFSHLVFAVAILAMPLNVILMRKNALYILLAIVLMHQSLVAVPEITDFYQYRRSALRDFRLGLRNSPVRTPSEMRARTPSP